MPLLTNAFLTVTRPRYTSGTKRTGFPTSAPYPLSGLEAHVDEELQEVPMMNGQLVLRLRYYVTIDLGIDVATGDVLTLTDLDGNAWPTDVPTGSAPGATNVAYRVLQHRDGLTNLIPCRVLVCERDQAGGPSHS